MQHLLSFFVGSETVQIQTLPCLFFHQSAMSLLADIYLKTNDWANATHAADIVLEKGKSHNKARLVKAEALFNVCQFEHAMVHFHRGMVSTKTDTVTIVPPYYIIDCRICYFSGSIPRSGTKTDFSIGCSKMQKNHI